MMRAILGLSIADIALLLALLKSDDHGVSDFFVLISPIVIFTVLAAWIDRKGFRQGIFILAASYSAIAAAVIWWTFFGGEHDAGYQLALLSIPFIGVLTVLVAGVAALSIKREAISAKRSD